MKLEVVKFIESNGLPALIDQFKIAVRRHGEFANLVQLKYSQTESPMGEAIVQECRGLILDEADNWRVIAYPFRKFFNYGEGHAAPIDWSTASVYEKLDGSLMILYWYRGQWRAASSGLPDASGRTGLSFTGTFADLFWKTWNGLGYRMPDRDDDDPGCLMFELMTPHNRVVCKQDKPRLVLIGSRGLDDDFQEIPAEGFDWTGWEIVKSYPLRSIEDCIASAAKLNPVEGEGYVVCDGNFNRVKVKSPQYVALAHMKEGLSGRRMLEIVRLNESDEVLAHFPEFRPLYERVKTAYDSLCDGVETVWAEIRGIDSRKDFALKAVKAKGSAALFAMKDGRAKSAREFFSASTLAGLEKCIGIDLTIDEPAEVQ